jgi:nitrate/nitrite transporter NarK
MEGNNRFIKKWAKTRSRNKWRYYLIYALIFGGFMGITLISVDLALKDFGLIKSILKMGMAIIFGLFNAILQWKTNERNYQEYLNKL